MELLSDNFRSERTIFYHDRDGHVYGRDFGPSTLVFSLMTAGRMPQDRVRIIFLPRIVRPVSPLENVARLENTTASKDRIAQTLEDLSFFVDMGPEEFTMIGPSSQETANSLIGSQLFRRWDGGQKKNIFILINPVEAEGERRK